MAVNIYGRMYSSSHTLMQRRQINRRVLIQYPVASIEVRWVAKGYLTTGAIWYRRRISAHSLHGRIIPNEILVIAGYFMQCDASNWIALYNCFTLPYSIRIHSKLFQYYCYQSLIAETSDIYWSLVSIRRVSVLGLLLISAIWTASIDDMTGEQLFMHIQSTSAFLAPPIAAVFVAAIFSGRATEAVSKFVGCNVRKHEVMSCVEYTVWEYTDRTLPTSL